jgi:hypothetical protein
MILSFGYLVLHQVLQLIALGMCGEQAKDVEILVPRHQSPGSGVASSGQAPGSGS